MLTSARIEQLLKPHAERGPFRPSLFEVRDSLALSSQDFPGERLLSCRNPLPAQERGARKWLDQA